jgi:hypothetical protein
MHADVTSGRVTPPHMNGASSTRDASKAQRGRTPYRRGPAMMQDSAPSGTNSGYTMMGGRY